MNDNVKSTCSVVERLSWLQIFLGMLTQLSTTVAFPAYTLVLGFWGIYCAFTSHARALFGYITFAAVSVILDIVFCVESAGKDGSPLYTFALVVFVMAMLVKLPTLWYASRLFSLVGGANALEGSAPSSPIKDRERGRDFSNI
jgi:hypothetical protein